MPQTKLSQILKPLLTGKKHSAPYTDHDSSWLCAKWREYLNRYYESAPKEGIKFIDEMLVEGKTLGQTSCQFRGCKTANIDHRPLKTEEVATLRIIRKSFVDKTAKEEPEDVHEAESPPPKKMKITTAQNSDLASLLDFNPENISNNSDEEEEKVEQNDARLAKIKTRREQIKKREENMKTELSKTPSKPWAFRLPPKTEAELRMEEEEDAKRERIRLSTQIFKLAHAVKQFDVLHGYKEFEKQEDLLEWLEDLFEQKEAGFEIEDDDSREAAWMQEKADQERKGLRTIMSDHKAKKLFFEYNQFLSQPLQISLIKKDACGTLNEEEKFDLTIQVMNLKVMLKQEKHPELSKKPVGRQLYFLQVMKNNKKRLQERGMWEDDSTRELKMKLAEEIQKQTEERVQQMLKDGNIEMFPRWEELVTDSQQMLALENSTPAITMEDLTDSDNETDVEEPPPCPVHLMR